MGSPKDPVDTGGQMGMGRRWVVSPKNISPSERRMDTGHWTVPVPHMRAFHPWATFWWAHQSPQCNLKMRAFREDTFLFILLTSHLNEPASTICLKSTTVQCPLLFLWWAHVRVICTTHLPCQPTSTCPVSTGHLWPRAISRKSLLRRHFFYRSLCIF